MRCARLRGRRRPAADQGGEEAGEEGGREVMFVRWKKVKNSMKCVVLESYRDEGKPRHKTIASLATIKSAYTDMNRKWFWYSIRQYMAFGYNFDFKTRV